jgi:Pyruvate/2-oxoacid:ferredoxin oxidoreductase gamma subunit
MINFKFMEKVLLIGGQAGEGIKASANMIGKALVKYGYYVFTY